MSKIGIIGAMDIEVRELISKLQAKKEEVISNITFTSGILGKNEVVIAQCGIGKVFAGICAQTMILRFAPDCIINTGVAGTLCQEANVMDIVIATEVLQHDMDTSPLGDPKGLISGISQIYFPADKNLCKELELCAKEQNAHCVFGVIASGDQFIVDPIKKEQLHTDFNAKACEMEGGAIGHVCYINHVPFCIVRSISDGEGASMDYMTFAKEAAHRSANIVEQFIINH